MANLWIVQESAAIPPQPLPLFAAPLASWATPRQGGHRNGINTHSRPGRARRAVASPNPVNNTTIHRFRVTPGDVSVVGVVDGGTLLERIHGAAYATAARRSGRRCVAAAIGDFHLDRPICVGELVDVRADLVYTGRSSMHVPCHRQRRRPCDGVGSTSQMPHRFRRRWRRRQRASRRTVEARLRRRSAARSARPTPRRATTFLEPYSSSTASAAITR